MFTRVPVRNVLRFSFPLLVGAYFLGFIAMGGIATGEHYQKIASQPCALSPAPFTVDGGAFEAAGQFHRLVTYYMANVPAVCGDRAPDNEFQVKQCEIFWDRFYALGLLALMPFGAALAALIFALDFAKGRYRKARKLLSEAKPTAIGVVTQPPEAHLDYFGRLLGLRAIAVQLPSKEQVVVYTDTNLPIPLAGAKFAVHEWGSAFGKKRYVGALHAPHMAIVTG